MARPLRRHVLGRGEPGATRALLESWGEGASAVAEGRVFVNRRRIDDIAHRLSPGDVLEVFAAARGAGAIMLVERRGDIVVIDKPSGIPSEPDEHGSGNSAREQAEALLGQRVHAASRLDLGVSGLMTLTLTAGARRHLAAARQRGSFARMYLALAGAMPTAAGGVWTAPIGRAQASETSYRVVASLNGGACVLLLRPRTGRLHQIRVHASQGGAPLLGDPRYGGARRWTLDNGSVIRFERVLLHSARLKLEDQEGRPWQLSSPAPEDFDAHFRSLGGVGSTQDLASW